MIMTISEKVAYLKGLADGLEIEKEPSREGKLIAKIIDILEEVGLAVEDLESEIEAIGDELDEVSENVSDLELMVYDEDDDDEDEEDDDDLSFLYDDDDFFEMECPECGESIVIDEDVLDVGEVVCPGCGNKFSLTEEEDEEEDETED